MNSKQKGKRGELELVKKLKEYGFDARRTQQYCGTEGDADIRGLPGIHIECKRVERLNLEEAMQQAVEDSAERPALPVVMHKRNGGQWMVTMLFDDWMELYGLKEENNE